MSSSISPFAVSESKSFRDFSLSSSSSKLYGLYIVDQNNSVSLIYDSINKFTDLASINFYTLSISYQRVFPMIENLLSVVFTSPTVFYAGVF